MAVLLFKLQRRLFFFFKPAALSAARLWAVSRSTAASLSYREQKQAGAPNQFGFDFRKCWYAKVKIEHSSSSAGGFDRVLGPVSVPRAGCLIVAVVEEAEPPL